VDGIGIVRDADAARGQLCSKSYRPRARRRRGFAELADPLGQLLRAVDRGLPEALAAAVVEGGEHLAPPAVQDRQPLALAGDSGGERVEGADAARRQPEAEAEAAGGGDADPQAGEGAGAEPDGEEVDSLPAPGGGRRRLDLGQQPGRVQGPPLLGEAQQRLVEDLAVAPGAGDGVYRRGVEADDEQGIATPSP
jgi:hypothetical protein